MADFPRGRLPPAPSSVLVWFYACLVTISAHAAPGDPLPGRRSGVGHSLDHAFVAQNPPVFEDVPVSHDHVKSKTQRGPEFVPAPPSSDAPRSPLSLPSSSRSQTLSRLPLPPEQEEIDTSPHSPPPPATLATASSSDGVGLGASTRLRQGEATSHIRDFDKAYDSTSINRDPSPGRSLLGECVPSIIFPSTDNGFVFTEGVPGSSGYIHDGGITSDGGLFAFGQITGSSPYLTLMYFDPALNLVWAKGVRSGGSAASNQQQRMTGFVSGDAIVVTGFTDFNSPSSGGDVFVAMFHANGTQLWSTVFGSSGNDFGVAVTQTTDGSYVVVGTSAVSDIGSHTGGFAAGLSSTGVLQWVTGIVNGPCYDVVALPGGGVIVSGVDDITSDWRFTLAHVSPSGAVVWANDYSSANPVLNVYLSLSSTGLLALSFVQYGNVTTNGVIVGIGIAVVDASDGSVQWARELPSASADEINDIGWAPDGSLLCTGLGSNSGATSNEDVLLLQFSAEGDLLYAVTMGGSADDVGSSFDITQDGRMVIVGSTSSYGAGLSNPLVIVLDSYASPPTLLGVLSVSDISTWWTHRALHLDLEVTSLSVSAVSISVALGLGSAVHIGTPDAPVALPPYNLTWLTFPLEASAFPFLTNAILEFPWSYVLPTHMYSHLEGVPLSLTLASNGTWISVYTSPLSLIGIPVLTSPGSFRVSIAATANIPLVGFVTFPPITLSVCLDESSPLSMTLFDVSRIVTATYSIPTRFAVAANGDVVFTSFLENPNDPLYADGILYRSSGSWDTIRWGLLPLNGAAAYASNTLSRLTSVAEAADGSLLSVGTMAVSGNGLDVLVMACGEEAAIVWRVTIGGSGDDQAMDVVIAGDGTVVVAGFTSSFGSGGYDVFVLSVSPLDGSTVWNFTYGGSGDEKLYKLAASPSGGIVGVGYTNSVGAGAEDCLILMFTTGGALVWARVFGGSGSDLLNSVVFSFLDGGILFTGSTTSVGAGGSDVLSGRLSPSGSLTQASVYGGAGNDVGSDVTLTVDGGMAITGYSTSSGSSGGKDILLVVYDVHGVVEWATLSGGSADDWGVSLQQDLLTHHYLVLGTASSYGSNPVFWMMCSSTGDLSPNFAGDSMYVTDLFSFTPWIGLSSVDPGPLFTLSTAVNQTAVPYTGVSQLVPLTSLSSTVLRRLEFFAGTFSQLPPLVTQVPFGKPFNMSVYASVNPHATFATIVELGESALPQWLALDRSLGVISGTPLGSVRGLYYIAPEVSVSQRVQSIVFILNVTNTAPYYVGPEVLETGLGDFIFSLRDYVFDAEGDAVSNYQFTALDGVLPPPIASMDSFTGQVVGSALSGSGGVYAFNLSKQDVFGAVGWTVIRLRVSEPSTIVAVLESLIPGVVAASLVLIVLFVIWHRDLSSSSAVHMIRDLAKLYCSSMQADQLRGSVEKLTQLRRAIKLEVRTSLDQLTFDDAGVRANLDSFCHQLLVFAISSRKEGLMAEVCGRVGLEKFLHMLATTVIRRLSMGPPGEVLGRKADLAAIEFHTKTLFLLNMMNQLLETALLVFGVQLQGFPLKHRMGFLECMLDLALAPVRLFRPAAECVTPRFVFAVDHTVRERMLQGANAIRRSVGGLFESRLEFFGTGAAGRRRTVLEMQLCHAAARLHQSAVFLPDSATAFQVFLHGLQDLLQLNPSALVADIKSIFQIPADWYSLYLSARLSLQAIVDPAQRPSLLLELQRNLFLQCFGRAPCRRRNMVVVSWKLLFGIAQLYGELLMSKQNPLTPLERARVRGDSPDMLREELLTLQYLAKMPLPGLWPAQQRWVAAAARNVLSLTTDKSHPPTAMPALALWSLQPLEYIRLSPDRLSAGYSLPASPKLRRLPYFTTGSPRHTSRQSDRSASGIASPLSLFGASKERKAEEGEGEPDWFAPPFRGSSRGSKVSPGLPSGNDEP